MQHNLITPELVSLREHFLAQGRDLRFVGGCVRDLLAGAQPKDVDLHTDANPQECELIYQQAGVRVADTGSSHGTFTVVLKGVPYEITSLRQDVSTDGRRATVSYTRDWHADLERRDFTINAMSMGFDGDLMDPFGGAADLSQGVVRFVGDARTRIQEDYLRILRWFRFRGRFGMHADLDTQLTVRRMAHGLRQISRERVWSEVSKIVSHSLGADLMLEMHQWDVTQHMDLPVEIDWIDLGQHVARMGANPVTVLVALYGSNASEILRAWKASSAEINLAQQLHDAMMNRWTPAYCMAVLGWPRQTAMELALLLEMDSFDRAVLASWDVPQFPVGGADLIQLGMKPGPRFGAVLDQLKQKWAHSGYQMNRHQLLSLVDL